MLRFIRQPLKISKNLKRYLSQETHSNEGLKYCANIVRQHDYEHYLATLLMTKAIRSPAMVVRAFNAEIARIQDQTTDVQAAAMRLQFWQDTIASIYEKQPKISNIPANPVAREIFKVCLAYKVPKRYFERLVTSRRQLLTTKYYKTMEDLEYYSENTVSSIYYILLCIAGVTDVHADHAASHLGKAQGIVNVLRSIYVTNHYKTVFLPMDILMKYEVSQESVLRCTDNSNMRNVVFDVASRAHSHLQKAKNIKVPKITKQIFLPAVAVERYLKILEKNNFNVFNRNLQNSGVRLPLSLYFNRLLNKY